MHTSVARFSLNILNTGLDIFFKLQVLVVHFGKAKVNKQDMNHIDTNT